MHISHAYTVMVQFKLLSGKIWQELDPKLWTKVEPPVPKINNFGSATQLKKYFIIFRVLYPFCLDQDLECVN